jgi:WD40 repeat protein
MVLRIMWLAVVVMGMCLLLVGAARVVGQATQSDVIAFTALSSVVNSDFTMSMQSSIYVLDLNTGYRRLVTSTAAALFHELAWNVEDGRLIFEADRGLFKIDFISRELTTILSYANSSRISALLANGDFIRKEDDRYVIRDSSSALAREYAFDTVDYSQPSWSPDGRYLGYMSSQGYVIFDTSAEHEIAHLPGLIGDTQSPVWSPHGRYAAFRTGASDTFLFEVETGSQQPIRMLPQVWSVDESKLLYQWDDDIYCLNLQDGSERQLTSDSGDEWPLAWSPDGKTILYVADPDNGPLFFLTLLDVSSLNRRVLIRGEMSYGSVAW